VDNCVIWFGILLAVVVAALQIARGVVLLLGMDDDPIFRALFWEGENN
jgi:hypothetical protein